MNLEKIGNLLGSIGSFINPIGGIIGGIIGKSSTDKTNESNLQIARENQAWQTGEREAQNQWSEMMYERQKQDNSLSSQVQQMREAGVNPASLNGNAFTPASAPSSAGVSGVAMPEMMNSGLPVAQMISQLGMQMAQMENIKADTEKKKAEGDKASEEARNVGRLALSQIGLNDAQISALGENVQIGWARVDMDFAKNQKQIELMESQIGINKEVEYLTSVKSAYLPAQIIKELEVMASQEDLNYADADLKRSGVLLNGSMMRKLAKECEYLGKLSEKCDWETVNEMNALLLGTADLDRKTIDNAIAEKYGESWIANHPTEAHYIDEAIDILKSLVSLGGSLGGATIIAKGAKGVAKASKTTSHKRVTPVYNRETGRVEQITEIWNQ